MNIFKIFSKKRTETAPTTALHVVLNTPKLCKMMPYFPIGSSLKFYPEYRSEVVLSSIIIAYLINGEIVYSNAEITFSDDEKQLFINNAPIEEVNSFAIMVPSETRGETELDYERKESLSQSGGFAKGNSITLIGKEKYGKTSTIDTVVKTYALLKEGYYSGTKVVVLNVDPALLSLKDQRIKKRLEAQIPGLIQTKDYTEFNQCTIIDFSEFTIKITCDDNDIVIMSCRKGETVTLTFDLPNSDEPNVMQGKVLRTEETSMIVELQDILIGETFKPLEPIDLIEIKAKLLQLPPRS